MNVNRVVYIVLISVFLLSTNTYGIDKFNGYYKIIAKHSGKCLDVYRGGSGDEANVQQYSCHSGEHQLWNIIPDGRGYYTIASKHSGKCLDVYCRSGCYEDEANVQQFSCHGGENQLWSILPNGSGYYKIISKHSGKCLDVYRGGSGDEANVQQYSCHSGENQLWRIVK